MGTSSSPRLFPLLSCLHLTWGVTRTAERELNLNVHGGLMNRPLELQEKEVGKGRVNPNKNSITEALGCYP
jgi:hypothetical protein